MFRLNGFTQKANDAVNMAIAQASALGHTYIGSEHILLGLASLSGSTAYAALSMRGVLACDITEILVKMVGRAEQSQLSPDDMTQCCKRIFETAVLEAKEFGVSTVGTEHLLLAIIREPESSAIEILRELSVDPSAVYKGSASCWEAQDRFRPRQEPSKDPSINPFPRL
jgi:ATP-dependent Clp protease ATP-binding subunit ClpC